MAAIPFTREQFMAVFAAYNEAVWPAQWLLLAAAVACVLLARPGTLRASRAACAILALLWAWMAVAYHWAFFTRINPAAPVFAAAFLAAAGLFAWSAVAGKIRFSLGSHAAPWGLLLVAIALAGYPLASRALGHHYPEAPTFGVPCPTTIFTLGMLLLSVAPVPRAVIAIPLLWAAVRCRVELRDARGPRPGLRRFPRPRPAAQGRRRGSGGKGRIGR